MGVNVMGFGIYLIEVECKSTNRSCRGRVTRSIYLIEVECKYFDPKEDKITVQVFI